MMVHRPLFPLQTVLFPGCRLPLQIFEQRYLEMIKRCLKQEEGFVVVLINEGQEVGVTSNIFSVGCEAQIVDWHQRENGLLGIVAQGQRRMSIQRARTQADGLLMGEVEYLEETPVYEHEQMDALAELLATLEAHPVVRELGFEVDQGELNALIWALSGLLPFNDHEKQYLLELNEPSMRVAAFNKLLRALQGDQA